MLTIHKPLGKGKKESLEFLSHSTIRMDVKGRQMTTNAGKHVCKTGTLTHY